MVKDDDTVTEAILDEIGRRGGVIESRLEAAERSWRPLIQLPELGLLSVYSKNQRVVLMGLPIAIAVIFIFMVQLYTEPQCIAVIAKHSRASLGGGLANPG